MPSLKVEGSVTCSTEWELQKIIKPEDTPFNFGQPNHKGVRETITFEAVNDGTNFKISRVSRIIISTEDGSKIEARNMRDLGFLKNGDTFFFAYNYIDENSPRHNYPQVIRVTQI